MLVDRDTAGAALGATDARREDEEAVARAKEAAEEDADRLVDELGMLAA